MTLLLKHLSTFYRRQHEAYYATAYIILYSLLAVTIIKLIGG